MQNPALFAKRDFMQNFKKRLQTNFTTIDNRIAQSNLSYEARGLYFYMQSLPDDWRFSEERLARAGGIGIDKIKRILKELFSIGLLMREIIKDARGHNLAIYTLFDFDTIKNPTLENPPLENPTLENPMYYKEIYFTKKKENKEIKETNTRTRSAREALLLFAKAEFEKANPAHITLESFLEWIEYKIERTPKMTSATITKNLNQLISFGEKATEAIQNSILSGWQGLFVPKENKSDLKHDSSQNNSQVNISYDENFKQLLSDYLCSKVGAIILGMRLVKFEILECGDVWLTLENNLRESMIRKIKAYEVKSVLDFWG